MLYISIINLGNWLYNTISEDFYINTIETFELIVAILTILIGGRKVSELITEYKKKKLEAIFGFYVNLGYFVKRIRPLITYDDNSVAKTLYLLSPDNSLKTQGNKILGKKLSKVSNECLKYLSTMANQIPPARNEQERVDWQNLLNIFVIYLNQFYLIDSGISLPNLSNEDDINIYFQDIKIVLDEIEKKVESQTKSFFNDMNDNNG